jgi:SAM-dependent methyltransferase
MISTLAHFAIADHLEAGPVSTQELAERTGTNERALYRLLRAAASMGVFTELEDGRFAQTPLSETLRSKASPGVRDMALMLRDDWHANAWQELPWAVETGRPPLYKLYGKGLFELLSSEPSRAVNFNNAMTNMSSIDSLAIAEAYDFSGFEHIVDVAGGHGMLLGAILKKTPALRGTLFEMPYVIEGAKNSPHLAPFKDRCDFVAGSFFDSLPPADAYIMKYILHDWDDESSRKILTNCRKTIRPGGKLLVADQVVAGRNEPSVAKIVDLEMLVLPGGKERTAEEWRDLFAASGFRLERIIPTQAMQCIIEGTPV